MNEVDVKNKFKKKVKTFCNCSSKDYYISNKSVILHQGFYCCLAPTADVFL